MNKQIKNKTYIPRERYIEKIRPFIGKDLIKVFTGIRRSGKSVMLELIKDELFDSGVKSKNIISFNFELISNFRLRTAEALHEELSQLIKPLKNKVYLFFDEIQEVENWEKCINSCRLEFECDIYITGSNAKLLSGELATYLAGRYVEFVIYPFSFEEYIKAKKINNSEIDIAKEFQSYLKTGGMPFLTNLQNNNEASNVYLQDLYNSVILKDVIKRNNIRDVDLMERVINYVFTNIGHTFSSTSISKYFKSEKRKVSHDTILNYIKACADAFLLYKINREEVSTKKILSVNEKYYIVDQGILNAVYDQKFKNIDQILENIVCLELLRRSYKVTVGKAGMKEIDFIAEKDGERIYIQVAYLLASQEVIDREFGVYKYVKDNFPKYVLSLDEFNMSRNGIKHRNLRDFLLEEKWN
jgi:hypothetical protein